MRRAPFILPGEREWVDAVIGIRTWRVNMDRGHVHLESVYTREPWTYRAPTLARCLCRGEAGYRADGRLIPGACQGKCGIYAWSEDLRAIEPVPVAHWVAGRLFVHGEVYLWGEIRVCEYGYRGEYAMPAGFFLPPKGAENHAIAQLAADEWELPLLELPPLHETEVMRDAGARYSIGHVPEVSVTLTTKVTPETYDALYCAQKNVEALRRK